MGVHLPAQFLARTASARSRTGRRTDRATGRTASGSPGCTHTGESSGSPRRIQPRQSRHSYPSRLEQLAVCRRIPAYVGYNQIRRMKHNGRILIADDQPDVLEALRLLLKGEGIEIETAHSPAGILAALEAREFDAVLM